MWDCTVEIHGIRRSMIASYGVLANFFFVLVFLWRSIWPLCCTIFLSHHPCYTSNLLICYTYIHLFSSKCLEASVPAVTILCHVLLGQDVLTWSECILLCGFLDWKSMMSLGTSLHLHFQCNTMDFMVYSKLRKLNKAIFTCHINNWKDSRIWVPFLINWCSVLDHIFWIPDNYTLPFHGKVMALDYYCPPLAII